MFSGTAGISFYYKGSGASNTIEFKLRLLFPGDTEETYFYYSKQISTNTGDQWKLVEVPYSSFVCKQPADHCAAAWTGNTRALDLTKAVKLDIAIANKPGDKAGIGAVTFDNVVGLSKNEASKIVYTDNLWNLIKILAFIILFAFIFFLPGPDGGLTEAERTEMNNTNRPWAYVRTKKK